MSNSAATDQHAEPAIRSIFTDAGSVKGIMGTDQTFLAKLFGVRAHSLTDAIKALYRPRR